jgi:hypothetical protein
MTRHIDQALLESGIVDNAQVLQDSQRMLILLKALRSEALDINMLASAYVAAIQALGRVFNDLFLFRNRARGPIRARGISIERQLVVAHGTLRWDSQTVDCGHLTAHKDGDISVKGIYLIYQVYQRTSRGFDLF